MKSYYIIILSVLLTNGGTRAQCKEDIIKSALCNRLIFLNDNMKKKSQFDNFGIAIDPITGKERVYIIPDVVSDSLRKYVMNNQEKIFNIIKYDTLPFYPLKHVVYIVDTMQYFSISDLNVSNITFRFIDKIELDSVVNNSIIYINHYRIRRDYLIVDCTFYNNMFGMRYYLNLKSSVFAVAKEAIYLRPISRGILE